MCMSKPKVPTPTAVIERQPYKNAPSRASLASGDSEMRRRMIAGIATSAQGVPSAASTTKRVMAGGDQVLAPVLTSGGSNPTAVLPSPDPVSTGPTQGGQTTPRAPTLLGAGVYAANNRNKRPRQAA